MSASNNNMKFFSPLLSLTCIFCAFPQFETRNQHGIKAKILMGFNKIFAVICLVFWTTVAAVAIYLEDAELALLRLNPNKELLPLKIMELAQERVLAIFSITSIICLGFIHRNTIHGLFKNLDQVDFILDFKLEKNKWQFWSLYFIQCLVQVIHIYNNYAFVKSVINTNILNAFVARMLQVIQYSLTLFTINMLCLHIYQRFKRLNSLLKKYDPQNDYEPPSLHHEGKQHKCFMFKELKRIHSILCNQIDSINEIFGLLLVWFLVTTITMICFYVVHILTVNDFSTQLTQLQKTQGLVICISGISFILIQICSLAWVGAMLERETEKTHKICYTLLNSLPCNPCPNREGCENIFRKEVKSLAIQSAFRKPFITAFNIFTVNLRILGTVLGSVTSYIIVAQQFLHEYQSKPTSKT